MAAENNTAFWTLMSSGANIGDGGPDGIGDAPTDLDAWSKLYLGWLDEQGDKGPFYEIVDAGADGTVRLSDNDEALSNGVQAMVVNLPDNVVQYTIGDPVQGDWMWYSDQGSNLENTMTKHGCLGRHADRAGQLRDGGGVRLLLRRGLVRRGATFPRWTPTCPTTPVTPVTTRTATTRPGSASPARSEGAWVDGDGDAAGRDDAVRFRYSTDPAVAESGVLVDDVKINGASIGDAEQADQGGCSTGSIRTNGTEESQLLQRLHRGEPSVRRLRQLVEDGVQLRVPRTPARTGWRPTRTRTAR